MYGNTASNDSLENSDIFIWQIEKVAIQILTPIEQYLFRFVRNRPFSFIIIIWIDRRKSILIFTFVVNCL